MSKYKMMVLVFCISGCLPTISYADEKVDFYAQFLSSFAQSPETIRNNLPARSEEFFRRHGVRNIHELRAGFNPTQLAELAQKLEREYQQVFRNPRSLIRSRALGILYQLINDIDPRRAVRLPRPQRRQSSNNRPQNAIEDSIKVNQQTRAVAQAAINQGYILGETKGPLRMPQISRPRNPTPGSFADRFRDRMPDQLGNDLGKQTGQLLDLDSHTRMPVLDQATRPATIRNPEPGEGFEFNEGGFITPDANFEPDPSGRETDSLQRNDQPIKQRPKKIDEMQSLRDDLDALKKSPTRVPGSSSGSREQSEALELLDRAVEKSMAHNGALSDDDTMNLLRPYKKTPSEMYKEFGISGYSQAFTEDVVQGLNRYLRPIRDQVPSFVTELPLVSTPIDYALNADQIINNGIGAISGYSVLDERYVSGRERVTMGRDFALDLAQPLKQVVKYGPKIIHKATTPPADIPF